MKNFFMYVWDKYPLIVFLCSYMIGSIFAMLVLIYTPKVTNFLFPKDPIVVPHNHAWSGFAPSIYVSK